MRPVPPRFPVLRPPPLRLVVAVVLAVVVALAVHRTTAQAAAVTSQLGRTTLVAVVQRPLAAGDQIAAGDVALVARPLALIPSGAVVEDPEGRTIRADVVPGEVLVSTRLAGRGRGGPAALIPSGWRAMAIPVLDAPIPVQPGATVDVVASFDPTLVERDPSVVVAAGAVVVDVAEEAVTVAVPRDELTDVAFALTNGVVTLALVG